MEQVITDLFAAFGALAFGACAGQIVVWLWRSDLRLVVSRQPEPAAEPVAAAEPITEDEFAEVHAWAQLNPWYAADMVLNMEAQIIHAGLKQRRPELPLRENLAAVTAEMHARHPEIVPTLQ